MNFNDLQNAWNSDGNEPKETQREKLTQQFLEVFRCQRRNQLIWLVWTFFALTVMTGLSVGLCSAPTKLISRLSGEFFR